MTTHDPDNSDGWKVIEIESVLSEAKKPRMAILEDVERCGYSEETRFGIKLAIEEAINNAIRHGNKEDSSKRITVRYKVSPELLTVCIKDQGEGFQPDCVPDPTTPDRISLPCGRGIMLMRAYMTDVQYRCNGREVVLTKHNPECANG